MSQYNGDWPGSPTDTALGGIGFSGGIRDRFVYQSLWECLNACLGELGWFEPTVFDEPPSNGTRKFHPLTFLDRQVEWDEDIIPNTVALVPENVVPQEWELGSQFMDMPWRYYATVIGANEAESIQLAGDIRDILLGRMNSVSRIGGPYVNIYNWSAATPYRIGYMIIEDVQVHRSPTFSQRWARYMRDVSWTCHDWYDSDLDQDDYAFSP